MCTVPYWTVIITSPSVCFLAYTHLIFPVINPSTQLSRLRTFVMNISRWVTYIPFRQIQAYYICKNLLSKELECDIIVVCSICTRYYKGPLLAGIAGRFFIPFPSLLFNKGKSRYSMFVLIIDYLSIGISRGVKVKSKKVPSMPIT